MQTFQIVLDIEQLEEELCLGTSPDAKPSNLVRPIALQAQVRRAEKAHDLAQAGGTGMASMVPLHTHRLCSTSDCGTNQMQSI
jgi:hypothetical protein